MSMTLAGLEPASFPSESDAPSITPWGPLVMLSEAQTTQDARGAYAHTGSRTRVTSKGSLYAAATLSAPVPTFEHAAIYVYVYIYIYRCIYIYVCIRRATPLQRDHGFLSVEGTVA